MCGIKISLFALCFLSTYLSIEAQSCSLACADSECGPLNVAFNPQGGPDFCEGEQIIFTNASDPGFDFFVLDWSDGTRDTVYNYTPVSHIYTIADSNLCDGDIIFEVCFRGVKECPAGISCASGSYDFKLKVRPKAVLTTTSQYCIEAPATLTQAACNETSYLWNFGDGQTSSDANPSHTYSSPGSYNITLTVFNECGQDAVAQSITVVEDPVAAVNWSPMDNSVCLSQIFTFEDVTNQLGTTTTWSIIPNDTSKWMFTDTLMSFNSDLIEVIFKETGTYTVRLTANNRCGTDIWEEVITVLEGPTASIVPGPHLCVDNASYNPFASYSNAGEIQSYNWQFPGASPGSSNVADPGPVIYNSPGTHMVTLTLQSECGSIVSTTSVTVDALPVIVMPSIPAVYCSGSSADTLVATPPGGTWSGPGITNPTLGIFNPANVPPGSTIDLVYHAVNGTCDAYDTVTTTVVASEIVMTVDAHVCEDHGAFQLMASPSGGTWTGVGVTNPSGTFNPDTSGVGTHFPVYHYLDSNGCMVDVSTEVMIQAFPLINMPDTSILCNEDIDLLLEDALQLTVSPSGGSNVWTFNGNPVDSTINGFGLIGFYPVAVLYTYETCQVTDSAVIEFISSTPLQISADTTLCINNGLFILQSNLSGTWSGPAVNTATGEVDLQNAGGGQHTYIFEHQPGTSCFQSDSVVLTIQDPGLTLNAGPDVSLCFGESSPYSLSPGLPAGGAWQGTGIIDPGLGQINLNVLINDTVYTYTYCIEDANLSGCMACDDISLIVHSLPDAGFQIVGTPCEDVPFSLVVDSCEVSNSYLWALGDGTTSTLCSFNHVYTNGGDFIIQLETESIYGCENVSTASVHVTSPPVASFDLLDDEGCAPFLVQVMNNSTGEITQHVWVIGQDTVLGFNPGLVTIDGLLADSIVPVQLIVENGCAAIREVDSILVHPYPVVNFGFNVDEGCSPLLVDFGNATLGNPENWAWELGNGVTSTDSIPLPQTYTTPSDSVSLYNVQLIASNMCGADTLVQTITVYPPDVTAFIQLDTVIGCQPLSVPAHALATPGSEIGWQVFLNGIQVTGSTDADPVFVLNEPGLHMIILSAARCGMDFDTAYVDVLPAPFVDFETDPVLCEEAVIQFNNLSLDVTNVDWDFGDGNGTQLFEPSHIYADAGVYLVTLSANSIINNCPAVQTIPVTVQERPVLSIDPQPHSGCPPLAITFTNTGTTVAHYVWFFGDGSPLDTFYQPDHVYVTSGQYTTDVFAYNVFGCFSDTLSIPVEIYPVPESAFSVSNGRFCARYDTLETSNHSVGANSYIWSMDDVPLGTDPPFFPFDSAGQYLLSLVAENTFGCRDTSSTLLSILPSPDADFTIPDSGGCAPLHVAFTNASLFSTQYEWIFGDGNSSIDVSPGHLYLDSGAYTVTLVSVNQNGCPNDTATGYVLVFPVPEAAFDFQKADTCGVPMDVQMINHTTGAIDYAWDFGDGQMTDLIHPLHRYMQDGTFPIMLIAGNIHGCYDTVTAAVEIYQQPLADFYFPTDKVCERDTVVLENNSLHAVTYCWRLDNALYSMEDDLVIVPDLQGVYTVTLVAKYNAYCQDSFSLPGGLKVFVTPEADFDYMADPQANILGDVQFTNLSVQYDQLHWDFGDGNRSMEENPFHEYDINRNIDVTLVAAHFNGGELTCIDSVTKSIAPEWLVTFYAPTALSPDHGDSLVSVFKPVGIGLAEYTIEIYSPWGQRVWHSDKIVDQMPAESWNGRLDNQGEVLPQGAFTWMARVRFVNGESRVYKGSVTLLR